MLLVEFVNWGRDGKEYRAIVTGEETKKKNEVVLNYRVMRGDKKEGDVKLNFDLEGGTIHITGLEIVVTPYVLCLLTCGLGHIVQEILDCWRKGNRTARKLLACLKKKGIAITLSLVECSISCLGGGSGGTDSNAPTP